MINEWGQNIKVLIAKAIARHKSKRTYPESIEIGLSDLISTPRKINVAIIDDKEFPWKDALENRGCAVTYFSDYIKPVTQANQKTKVHNLSSFDIIICDIHGVGSSIYPGMEGLGVMEELRKKNPFHVIAAYTGDPGAIYSKSKRHNLLDFVFSRDWVDDDFLLNFDELMKIFNSPKYRWEFIRKRLCYLGVGENKIDEIRIVFVEKVILGQMLKQRLNISLIKTKELVVSPPQSLDLLGLAKFGIGTAEIGSLLTPFILD